MKTTFKHPNDAAGKVATVTITNYFSQPYTNGNAQHIEEVLSKTSHEIETTPDILTHDTVLWTGYYINLRLLSRKAATYAESKYYGVTLENVK